LVVKISAPQNAVSFGGGLPPPKMTTARPAASVVFAGKVKRLLVASATTTPETSTALLELFSNSTNSSSSESRTPSRLASPSIAVVAGLSGATSALISLMTSGTETFSVAVPEAVPPDPSGVEAVIVTLPTPAPRASPAESLIAIFGLLEFQVQVTPFSQLF